MTSEELEVGSQEWKDSLFEVINTKAWQKTLLDVLDKDELIDGYPSTDGLARLFRLIYGDFQTDIEVPKCPNVDDRSATVIVTISCYTQDRDIRHTGSADVSINNTKPPYCYHPVATAETKALGRALKRALRLRIHTHEEMLNADGVAFEPIQEQQVRAIENMSKKLGVNLDLLLAEQCGTTYASFTSKDSTISKSDALKLLDILNVMQNKGVPDNYRVTI